MGYGEPIVDSDVKASRERVRRGASESAVPADAAEAEARPGEETTRGGSRWRDKLSNLGMCQLRLLDYHIPGTWCALHYEYSYVRTSLGRLKPILGSHLVSTI